VGHPRCGMRATLKLLNAIASRWERMGDERIIAKALVDRDGPSCRKVGFPFTWQIYWSSCRRLV
jgi:hypothetical protein